MNASDQSDLLDATTIENLATNLGREVTLQAVGVFENDLRQSLQNLAESVQAVDFEGVSRWCHRMKGLALQFGAKELGRICADLELTPQKVSYQTVQELGSLTNLSLKTVRDHCDTVS